jgi:uncharacterized tellurite resistance protein B-like protein
MASKNEHIADLLMGAAFADKRLDGREYAAVKKLLAQAMSASTIPPAMEDHLKNFDPRSFDPRKTVAALELSGNDEKRKLVELIAAVNDADEELDLDEDAYLKNVAKALGLPDSSYQDLSLEILSVETVKAAGEALLQPPALPKKK